MGLSIRFPPVNGEVGVGAVWTYARYPAPAFHGSRKAAFDCNSASVSDSGQRSERACILHVISRRLSNHVRVSPTAICYTVMQFSLLVPVTAYIPSWHPLTLLPTSMFVGPGHDLRASRPRREPSCGNSESGLAMSARLSLRHPLYPTHTHPPPRRRDNCRGTASARGSQLQ